MNGNAITQLKQWKSQNKPQNEAKTQLSGQDKANTPPKAKTPQNAIKGDLQAVKKAGNFAIFPQTTRQFEISADSIVICKKNFPDCFYHKHQQAKECKQISKALMIGLDVADGKTVSSEERKALRKVLGYLIHQFNSVHETVKRVDKGDLCELKHLRETPF